MRTCRKASWLLFGRIGLSPEERDLWELSNEIVDDITLSTCNPAYIVGDTIDAVDKVRELSGYLPTPVKIQIPGEKWAKAGVKVYKLSWSCK